MNTVLWVVGRNLVLAIGLLVLVHLLVVLLYREWVKAEVRRRAFVPIRIRWRPLESSRFYCAFSTTHQSPSISGLCLGLPFPLGESWPGCAVSAKARPWHTATCPPVASDNRRSKSGRMTDLADPVKSVVLASSLR